MYRGSGFIIPNCYMYSENVEGEDQKLFAECMGRILF